MADWQVPAGTHARTAVPKACYSMRTRGNQLRAVTAHKSQERLLHKQQHMAGTASYCSGRHAATR